MKNPTDAVGNELFKGDLVTVDLEDIKWKMVRIAEVSPGGVALPGKGNRQTSARVRIVLDMNIDVGPGQAITRLLKIVDPQQQEALKRMLTN